MEEVLGQKAYEIVVGSLLIISMYTVFAIIMFDIAPRNRRRVTRNENRDRFAFGSISGSSQNQSQRLMSWLPVLMSLITTAHILLDVVDEFVGVKSTVGKCIWTALQYTFYLMSMFCLYVFLWIRQRAFYSHPILQHLASRCIINYSWSVLGAIIVAILGVEATVLLPYVTHYSQEVVRNYTLNATLTNASLYQNMDVPIQCSYKRKRLYLSVHLFFTVAFLYFQISLQFLFAYPILNHRRKMKENTLHRNTVRREFSHPGSSFCSSGEADLELEIKKNYELYDSRSIKGSSEDNCTTGEYEFLTEDIAIANHQKEFRTQSCRLPKNESFNAYLKNKTIRDCTDDENENFNSKSLTKTAKVANSLPNLNRLKRSVDHNSSIKRNLLPQRKSTRRALKRDTLVEYIRRCLIMAFLCMLTDVATFLITFLAQVNSNNKFTLWSSDGVMVVDPVQTSRLTSLIVDINMYVNLLCVILCYNDWSGRLFPWFG